MKNFKELRESSQGLAEEKMSLSSRLYKQFRKDIDKIMKKHDAYVSDSNTKYTTISSPKPMQGGFKKDLFSLLGMTESEAKEDNLDEFGSKNMSAADKANLRRRIKNKKKEDVDVQEETIQEGTWAVPDNQEKLRTLQYKFLTKKVKGTKQNAKTFAKNIYPIFGDDEFFDDLLRIENDPDTSVDLRDLLMKNLAGWNMKFKPSGMSWVITHAPKSWWEPKEVEETAKKRKSGNIRPTGLGAPMKGKVLPLDEAYKDPSKSFPRDKEWKALCRKHKRHIMALQNKGKDLPNDAEEDFVSWGMENGKINDSDEIEKFIEDELLNASYIPTTGYNLFEKYRSRYKPSDIAKAVEIALAMADAMTPAIDKIEKIKRGLSDDPVVRGALRTANESVEEARGATGLDNAALVKRVPKRFKGIDQDTAQRVADAVKPKGMISSKLYMELGDLWDKKNTKGFEALLTKHKV